MMSLKYKLLAKAKNLGKLVLLCFLPAIILKLRQHFWKYEKFIRKELRSSAKISFIKKIWAIRHGFYVDRVLFYNLKKDNIKQYMPDFNHDILHPLNGRFTSLIDDKLQLPFLLKDFPQYVPTYYYLIYDSEMIDLSDNCREVEVYAPNKLLSILKEVCKLLIKPIAESGGEGVLLIEENDGFIIINGSRYKQEDAAMRLMNLKSHIVCQFVYQHEYAVTLYPLTTNTIRFITMRDYNIYKAFIGACFHRIGTVRSIPVDNFAAGGILCSIDLETGTIGHGLMQLRDGSVNHCNTHPDTGVTFSGKLIPNWDYIKSEVLRMADRLAFLPYMGWDIVITNDGFKVLEINSLPTLLWQIHSPICDNPRVIEFYRHIIQKKSMNNRSR